MKHQFLSNFLNAKLASENITSAEMARKIGISKSSLCLYLHGDRFPEGIPMLKIIKAYPDIMLMVPYDRI